MSETSYNGITTLVVNDNLSYHTFKAKTATTINFQSSADTYFFNNADAHPTSHMELNTTNIYFIECTKLLGTVTVGPDVRHVILDDASWHITDRITTKSQYTVIARFKSIPPAILDMLPGPFAKKDT